MTSRRPNAPPSRSKRSQQVIQRAEERAKLAKVPIDDPRERNRKERDHQGTIAQNARLQGTRHDR